MATALSAVLQALGRSGQQIGADLSARNAAEAKAANDLAKEEKRSKAKRAETTRLEERSDRIRTQKEEISARGKKEKLNAETAKSERLTREKLLKSDQTIADKRRKEAKADDTPDARFNQFLKGEYKPANENEAAFFKKKLSSGRSTKSKESPKTLADAWNQWLSLPAGTKDGFNDFDDFVSQSEKNLGVKFNRGDGAAEGGGSSIDGLGSASTDIPQTNQAFDVSFPGGLNAFNAGTFPGQIPPNVNPADTIPATQGPDPNQVAEFQTVSPRNVDEGVIDITDEVDPTFRYDPERNEDAARADALLSRPPRTWGKEDREWLDQWILSLEQ